MITKRMESIGVADVVLCKTASLLYCDGEVHREPRVPCASGARRNLFGCIEDSSAVNEMLLRQSGEMAQRAALLWNFDFVAERPIPGGRYVWERVGPETTPVKGDTGEKENALSPKTDSKNTCNTGKSSKLLQTSLKGYMPVLKRKSSSHRPISKKTPTKVRFLAPRECCILNTTGLSERS